MEALSVSFRIDDGVIEHNNREFLPQNADANRTPDNITYINRDLREFYGELFDDALAEYNKKKTRADRKIWDYYDHIKNGKQEKTFYELVVQFGDEKTCGLNSGNWELAKEMLDEYFREFEQRNPNMKVFCANLHLDEATPHLHIDFVPVCHNQDARTENACFYAQRVSGARIFRRLVKGYRVGGVGRQRAKIYDGDFTAARLKTRFQKQSSTARFG